MWNLKCTIVPVIIGATGIVTRNLKKSLETVPGKHSIDSLQKTAILGTSHIIRKVMQCEAWSLSGGDHRWFKRSTRKKCPWQRHPYRIIIIIKAKFCGVLYTSEGQRLLPRITNTYKCLSHFQKSERHSDKCTTRYKGKRLIFSSCIHCRYRPPLPKAPCYQFRKSHTFIFDIRTPDSIVGIMNSPRAWWSLVRFPLSCFFSPHLSGRLWGSPSLPFNGFRRSYPGGSARGLKMTSHLHLVPSLWMIGVTFLLLPYLPSWRAQAQLCINCVCAADWQSDVSRCFITWRKTTFLL